MTAGVVTVTEAYTIDDHAAIKIALEALYTGVNDKWFPIQQGGQFKIVHVNGG